MTEVVTVATDVDAGGFRRLHDSLMKVGASVTVLGQGEPFWGYCWRFRQYVEHARKSSADVLLFADGYDSVCLAPVDVLVERFLDQAHPLLFSFEGSPQPEYWLSLNPGLFVAQREAFVSIFTDELLEELFPPHFNDMFQLQLLWSLNPKLFEVDSKGACFFTQEPAARLVDRAGELVDPVTGAAPCFVHAPHAESLENVDSWLEGLKAIAP